MLNMFARWINIEKGIFLGAALALAVSGFAFQRTEVTRQWGEPLCEEPVPRVKPVSLDSPPPLPGFLAGGRGSPFAGAERTERIAAPGLPVLSPPPPKPVVKEDTPALPPPPPPPVAAIPIEEIVAETPLPYDLPMTLAGRVSVGDVEGRIVFVVKEDGRYISVKEGEELPGLGVKLVRATKSIVIVENAEGRRFRLDDLLRVHEPKDAGAGGRDAGGDGAKPKR